MPTRDEIRDRLLRLMHEDGTNHLQKEGVLAKDFPKMDRPSFVQTEIRMMIAEQLIEANVSGGFNLTAQGRRIISEGGWIAYLQRIEQEKNGKEADRRRSHWSLVISIVATIIATVVLLVAFLSMPNEPKIERIEGHPVQP